MVSLSKGRKRRIFASKSEEVIGGRRRLHNEELHELYSLNIIRVIKSRKMRWTGRATDMAEVISAYIILVRNQKGDIGRRRLGWVHGQ